MSNLKKALLVSALIPTLLSGCSVSGTNQERVIPAEAFSQAVHGGKGKNFTIFDHTNRNGGPVTPEGRAIRAAAIADSADQVVQAKFDQARARYQEASTHGAPTQGSELPAANQPTAEIHPVAGQVPLREMAPKAGDPKYLERGLTLQKSMEVPSEQIPVPAEYGRESLPPPPPPGSSSPYFLGQMTTNPSLWPDESMATSMFRDLRAFQPMDLVTIIINENNDGQKQSRTDARSKFSLLAAIESFFGFESDWTKNNPGPTTEAGVALPGLNPEQLVSATTEMAYEGNGQARRLGTLRAQMSAVILEVLPNGVLRIEGTKIVSVDNEEEVMVISGLVRQRDINATNQVDSNRIANMRIDFYGRGVIGETTSPGWGARLFRAAWPF